MEVWAGMDQRMPLGEVAQHARRAEALGYDGLNVPDAVHDGLLIAQAALSATTRLRVATSVLVAFPRSPMNVAHAAWDLQSFSSGRFELGLGSQVRGNIVGRYSTSWSAPVPRMREYLAALRAIFACWHDGEKLQFEGEHYHFTKMQPFFNPGPLDSAPPRIHLAAIGPAMTALAGEAADGLMCHPTNSSPRYLREVMWPRLECGAERTHRKLAELVVMAADMVATGPDPESVRTAREGIRELFGFLFSTRAYWPSLELYGFSGLGEELLSLTRKGEWAELTEQIPDELLDLLVPRGIYSEIADVLRARFEGLANRLTFPLPEDPLLEPVVADVIQALRA